MNTNTCIFNTVETDRHKCSKCGFTISLKTNPKKIKRRCVESHEEYVDLKAPILNKGCGTELKSLLSKIGIHATKNCSCNAKANEMDHKGPEWCEENIEQIVDWMKAESENRGLPFLRIAGRKLVRMAIKRASGAK
jgi:hypothetical protein